MAIVDTSLLVPLVDRGHPHHARARRKATDHSIWHITGGVLAEFTQVIRRIANDQAQDGNAAARKALDALRETTGYRPLVTFDEPLIARIYSMDPALSYVDAWGIAVALERQEPLLTLDEHQATVLERLL